MILFRIISNLIRLVLNLFWLPINILTKNLFLVIILISIVAFFVILNNDDSPQDTLTIPADSVQGATTANAIRTPPVAAPPAKEMPLVVLPVRKQENGNSSFATDLMKLMNDNERSYYSQIFYWTMNNAAAGKTIKWENINTFGSITPQAIFLNKRGYACRNFNEVLKVQDIRQTFKGIACQRGGGAWCKLGPNATPACGLGQVPSFWGNIKRSVGL